MMIEGYQIRAARGMLNWTRNELGQLSGVSVETIKNLETGVWNPRAETMEKLIKVFTDHGVGFSEGGIYRRVHRCPHCGGNL